MPVDRDRDLVNENVEEDAMPPRVDNPDPNYTFLSEMTPLSFTSTSTSALTANPDTNPQPAASLPSSPAISPTASEAPTPMVGTQARTHGKKRDASYIPRPPNAFILFRCAFIKEQNVPGKVEGNHSRLSKIIGLCWKQLPQQERDKWEARAIEAQAEHRAQYPDWRFRPAANAMSKPKVKEGGPIVPSRQRSVRSRARNLQEQGIGEESTSGPSDTKGKGKERSSAKLKSAHPLSFEEVRCAKIAELVAEGLKGDDLEIAVREWEEKHKTTKASPKALKSKTRSRGASSTSYARSHSDMASTSQSSRRSNKRKPSEKILEETASTDTQSSTTPIVDSSPKQAFSEADSLRSAAPDANSLSLANVPLTQMYRRSSSSPALRGQLSRLPSSTLSPEASDSSNDETSPTSAEPSPVSWGSLKSLASRAVESTRTHKPPGRDTIQYSIPSKSATFDSPHQLTWQEAEDQRRLEEVQGPDSWWAQRSQAADPRFVYSRPTELRNDVAPPLSTTGYGVAPGGDQFNAGYIAQYGSFESRQDGGQRLAWGSSTDRPTHVTVIDDPYKDDCNDNENENSPTVVSSPSTLSHPLSSSYYHSRVTPQASPAIPSSSFSSLTGWAGDYKYQSSDVRSWPSESASTPVASSSSSNWYSQDGTWGVSPSEQQHPPLQMSHADWDRLEDRASRDLHLQVEPPRQLDFMTELRRLHSGNNQS